MISVSKVYNFLICIFMLCFLLAASGFLLAYRGNRYMGWYLGVIGIVIGNLTIGAFLIVRFFGTHFKFLNFGKISERSQLVL
jgi:hypothetical protein